MAARKPRAPRAPTASAIRAHEPLQRVLLDLDQRLRRAERKLRRITGEPIATDVIGFRLDDDDRPA